MSENYDELPVDIAEQIASGFRNELAGYDTSQWLERGLDALMKTGAVSTTNSSTYPPSLDEMVALFGELKDRYERGKEEAGWADFVIMRRSTWESAKKKLGSHFSGTLHTTTLYDIPVFVFDTDEEIQKKAIELMSQGKHVLLVE